MQPWTDPGASGRWVSCALRAQMRVGLVGVLLCWGTVAGAVPPTVTTEAIGNT